MNQSLQRTVNLLLNAWLFSWVRFDLYQLEIPTCPSTDRNRCIFIQLQVHLNPVLALVFATCCRSYDDMQLSHISLCCQIFTRGILVGDNNIVCDFFGSYHLCTLNMETAAKY